jgi:hypothetical protein
MSCIQTGKTTHDATCNLSEGARQARRAQYRDRRVGAVTGRRQHQ